MHLIDIPFVSQEKRPIPKTILIPDFSFSLSFFFWLSTFERCLVKQQKYELSEQQQILDPQGE